MSDSDGTLAKVSYFPGVARPSEPAGTVPAEPAPSEDGWYVEPAEAPSGVAGPSSETRDDRSARESPRARSLANVAPLRPAMTAPDHTVDPHENEPAVAPVADTPALARMRALIAEAERRTDADPSDAPVAAEGGGRQRRPYPKFSVDEEPGEDDEPPTAEELAARAERVSMSALTRKGLSSWELAERLRAQDLDEETIANEIERLERVGLLDDRDLAETLVRTLQERKGLGRSGIMGELRRRHVDPEAIEEALSALDTDDEGARALEIALRRAPQLRSLDATTAQRRLSAFLMRKGYSSSAISFAVAGALKGSSGPRFR